MEKEEEMSEKEDGGRGEQERNEREVSEEREAGQTTGEFLDSFWGKIQRPGSDCLTCCSVSYYFSHTISVCGEKEERRAVCWRIALRVALRHN